MKLKKIEKEKRISLKIEENILEEIDTFADKMKLNRSQLLRNMIDNGLDDLKIMQVTGILSMAIKGYDLLDILKKSLKNKSYKIEDDRRLIIDLD